MTIREYSPTDYATLANWWAGHGWEPVPEIVLPKLGMVAVGEDDYMVAAVWLYMDNSVGVSFLEWLVTNPEAAPIQTAKAVTHIVNFMADRALEMDYGVMITTCRQQSLTRLYEKNGFMKTDEGVTHLLRMLKQ